MARLNEPPPAVDALEILRRKFLRQNRDIARENSVKSLRIRSLENEVSRLLAENLGFREQIAQLENEMSASKNRRIIDHVNVTKAKLEKKMVEMAALISEIKHVPASRRRVSTEPRQATAVRSPSQKLQREIYTMNEAIALQEGRLPPILEAKQYPRRTLDQAQLLELVSDQPPEPGDSPDIRPPSISKLFHDDDPVKIDLVSRPKSNLDENLDLDPVLSVNLEQRRKRRESGGAPEPKTDRISDEGVAQPSQSLLKTGAKRKLSVRDDDAPVAINESTTTTADDFKLIRRSSDDKPVSKVSTNTSEGLGNRAKRDLAVARGVRRETKAADGASLAPRKALGGKSANVDVSNSPRKAMSAKVATDKSVNLAKDVKERGDRRPKKEDALTIEAVNKPMGKTVSIHPEPTIEPEPETPASMPNLFSPVESAPSTARPDSRDTPPPPGLGLDGIRPSRRARAAVSYAEPNLRDKMRRPTKELVDAVTGEGKAHRLSILNLENDVPGSSSHFKSESEMDNSWKNLPSATSVNLYANSPLGNKSMTAEVGSQNGQGILNQKVSSLQLGGEPGALRTGSGSTISTLIGGSRKARQEPKEVTFAQGAATDKADIFEFKETPPAREKDRHIISANDGGHSKGSRRYSTAREDIGRTVKADLIEADKKIKPITAMRRRQSTLGIENSLQNSEAKDMAVDDASSRLASTISTGDSHTETTRSERAAGRRRSMML